MSWLHVLAQPRDMIDINGVVFHASSDDVKNWPITTSISEIELKSGSPQQADVGVRPVFDMSRWPNFSVPGWEPGGEGLKYTLWLFVQMNGRWHGAGVLEFWGTRPWSGAPLLTQYNDWIYGGGWGEMVNYYPQPGDTIGFMTAAGDHRLNKNIFSVRERSNIVTVKLVGDAHYRFSSEPVPPPNPPTVPVPTPPAPPTNPKPQTTDLGPLWDRLKALEAKVQRVETRLTTLDSRKIPISCTAFTQFFAISCRLVTE